MSTGNTDKGEVVIDLMQIEQTDIPMVREVLNIFPSRNKLVPQSWRHVASKLKQMLMDPCCYVFSVRTSMAGDFRRNTVGYCYLEKIDWINSHAGFNVHLREESLMAKAAEKLCIYAFDELNLNKVYVEVPGYCEHMSNILPALGFVLDGVRKKAKFKIGKYWDINVFSLLREEAEFP